MNSFQIIITWNDSKNSNETILNSMYLPKDAGQSYLEGVYDLFMLKITQELDTPEKCLHYLHLNNAGPFEHNHIDRPYNLETIDIKLHLHHHTLDIDRDHVNYIINFDKYFEIIKDGSEFTWRCA